MFGEPLPRRSEEKERAAHFRRGAYLLPSVFTIANLFCGYACIVFAMRGEFHTAAPFIGIAFIMDALDGRIRGARHEHASVGRRQHEIFASADFAVGVAEEEEEEAGKDEKRHR